MRRERGATYATLLSGGLPPGKSISKGRGFGVAPSKLTPPNWRGHHGSRESRREAMKMPGPMRRMARTAAVAGTAAHVAGKHQAEKDAAAAAAATPAEQPAPAAAAPVPAPPAGMTDDKMAELERLGQLKADGILTEDEFAAQKAKILAG